MTRARRALIHARMLAIRAACDQCLGDDPPWYHIEEAFDFVDELLTEAAANAGEDDA